MSGVLVLILGGGLAGLTTAYELGKVGYDCRVLEARARPGGRVFTVRRGTVSEEVYTDADGRPRRVDADYCVCTIPLPVLSGLQNDSSPPVLSAVSAASYDGAGKIGLQFKRRFWEADYETMSAYCGRIHEIGQIIYPSHGFHGRKGILVGYYLDFKRTMRERTPAERQHSALEQGARMHPQVPDRLRDGILRLVAACAVEPRLLAVGNGRGTPSARCAPATRWTGALRRRLHDEHELVDAGGVRIGPLGGDGHPPRRSRALITVIAPCPGLGASLGGFEQLDRVAVRILDLDLVARLDPFASRCENARRHP